MFGNNMSGAYHSTMLGGKVRAAGGWTPDMSAPPGVGIRGCKKRGHIRYGASVRMTL